MADYYTQFSCLFDVGSAENAARAMAIRDKLEADLDRDEDQEIGFDMDHGKDSSGILIHRCRLAESVHQTSAAPGKAVH